MGGGRGIGRRGWVEGERCDKSPRPSTVTSYHSGLISVEFVDKHTV